MLRLTCAATVFVLAWIYAIIPVTAQVNDNRDLPGVRPPLAEVRPWIAAGEGKRAATEVINRLGPPDQVTRQAGAAGMALTWEEDAWIRIFFRNGKARRIDGRFAPHASGGALTLANFRKLRPGATRKATEALLGKPGEEWAFMKDGQRCEWARRNALTVTFTPEQLAGLETLAGAGKAPVGVRPALSTELRQWLEAGRGRLTESEVYRKMGPPDFVFNPANPDTGERADEIGMIWREQARIEVDFKDAVTWKLKGEFAPHARSERITFDHFRQLQIGMSEVRVEDILGLADDEAKPQPDLRRQIWVARQEMVVYICAGKVSHVTWWGPF